MIYIYIYRCKKSFERAHVSKIYSNNPKIVQKVIKKDEELLRNLYNEKSTSDLSVI